MVVVVEEAEEEAEEAAGCATTASGESKGALREVSMEGMRLEESVEDELEALCFAEVAEEEGVDDDPGDQASSTGATGPPKSTLYSSTALYTILCAFSALSILA